MHEKRCQKQRYLIYFRILCKLRVQASALVTTTSPYNKGPTYTMSNARSARVAYVPGVTGSSFENFYPFYLSEHANPTCRRLHVLGTTGVVSLLAAAALTASPWLLVWTPLVGYGAAWIGHFFFEHNRPATFKHPFYSLLGDFRLWFEVVSGHRPF